MEMWIIALVREGHVVEMSFGRGGITFLTGRFMIFFCVRTFH
jgi:hypothetical protein